MRDPNNLHFINNTPQEIIVIDHIPEYDIPDYNLDNPKSYNKFILDIKRAIRNSREYNKMINYLRTYGNMNECSFYKNINNIDTNKIKIHIHHDPFDIETIIKIVVNKRTTLNEDIEIEMCAKEVMYLHYKMIIGLIPLAETVHELVHNSFLFIPVNKVYGNYQLFYNMYEPYMDANTKYLYDEIIKYSQLYNEEIAKNILDTRYVYIDVTGSYELPSYEVMSELMNKRIGEIKELYSINNQNTRLIEPVRFFDSNGKEVF